MENTHALGCYKMAAPDGLNDKQGRQNAVAFTADADDVFVCRCALDVMAGIRHTHRTCDYACGNGVMWVAFWVGDVRRVRCAFMVSLDRRTYIRCMCLFVCSVFSVSVYVLLTDCLQRFLLRDAKAHDAKACTSHSIAMR